MLRHMRLPRIHSVCRVALVPPQGLNPCVLMISRQHDRPPGLKRDLGSKCVGEERSRRPSGETMLNRSCWAPDYSRHWVARSLKSWVASAALDLAPPHPRGGISSKMPGRSALGGARTVSCVCVAPGEAVLVAWGHAPVPSPTVRPPRSDYFGNAHWATSVYAAHLRRPSAQGPAAASFAQAHVRRQPLGIPGGARSPTTLPPCRPSRCATAPSAATRRCLGMRPGCGGPLQSVPH